jgi:C-terminal processing protease CtpA/Prc
LKVVAPKKVRGVVIDLRNNGGGDNHTYVPLLDALQKLARKKKHVVVLLSRATFSAAENFAVDVERRAKATFVGEPSGGAPNLYGDPFPVDLPGAGLRAYVARIYWQKSTPNDPRLTITPKVPVPLTSADYFAGRDPQLAAAVARARSG